MYEARCHSFLFVLSSICRRARLYGQLNPIHTKDKHTAADRQTYFVIKLHSSTVYYMGVDFSRNARLRTKRDLPKMPQQEQQHHACE